MKEGDVKRGGDGKKVKTAFEIEPGTHRYEGNFVITHTHTHT